MSILIDSVTPHPPAAKAGIQAGDRLVAVNGNLMFNVDMMLGGGEAGTSSIGGKVGVKYAF